MTKKHQILLRVDDDDMARVRELTAYLSTDNAQEAIRAVIRMAAGGVAEEKRRAPAERAP